MMKRGVFMRVRPSQLVPGCVLLKDVMGKTMSPIVHKDTVLNGTHILFLQKFSVPDVEVSGKLDDGSMFKPEAITDEEDTASPQVKKEGNPSLKAIYLHAVESYEKMFTTWRHHKEIDMPPIRKFMLPLFERLDEFDTAIFTLHQ